MIIVIFHNYYVLQKNSRYLLSYMTASPKKPKKNLKTNPV